MDFLPVWQKHKAAIFRFLRKRINDPAAIDDLLQVTFIKASQHWAQLRDPDKARVWLLQIARNTLLDFFRKGTQEQQLQQQLRQTLLYSSPDDHEEQQTQLARYIPEAIQLLPEKYREAIRLTELEGLSQKELAQRLGISYSGAKSRVQRGREKLKEIIQECCLVEADTYGNIIDYRPRPQSCDQDCKKNTL